MLIVSSVEAIKLSLIFFSFNWLVWFLTKQWLHLRSYISTAMKKKSISLLISMQTWLESRKEKLFENKTCTKIKRIIIILSKCRLAQIRENYLWAEFVCFEVRDFFILPFSRLTSIFSPQREHFKKL